LKKSNKPTFEPTYEPTYEPSLEPTYEPSLEPSNEPSLFPTPIPSLLPSIQTHYTSSSDSSIPPGAIAGIVIAIVLVILIIMYYFKNHFQYLKRFIKIPIIKINEYDFLSGQKREVKTPKSYKDILGEDFSEDIENPIHESTSTKSDTLSPINNEEDIFEKDPFKETVLITGIEKAGYLMKKSTGINKNWLKRWFFIKDGKLFYVHKQSDLVGKKDIAAVPIANLVISTVRTNYIKNNKEFQIISPGQRGTGLGGGVYELMAESEEIAQEWILVVKSQIEGSLSKSIKATDRNNGNVRLFIPDELVIKQITTFNNTCADCGCVSPDWASINLCILICIECSGVHRNMGSHISKVRSIKLDKWSNNCIKLLLKIGNINSNLLWEKSILNGKYEKKINFESLREDREKFIKDKYENKLFIDSVDSKNNLQDNSLFLSYLTAAKDGDCYVLINCLLNGIEIDKMVDNNLLNAEADIILRDKLLFFYQKSALFISCENGNSLCAELLCLWNG
jgi:hypothetical protein